MRLRRPSYHTGDMTTRPFAETLLIPSAAVLHQASAKAPRRPSVPNDGICLHQFLPILAHIIPPHLLNARCLEPLPRN
jgi:hypothetical protein